MARAFHIHTVYADGNFIVAQIVTKLGPEYINKYRNVLEMAGLGLHASHPL